ncbi:MAG: hypothetical protein ACYC7E_13010 [Armatimonadota bacterium]
MRYTTAVRTTDEFKNRLQQSMGLLRLLICLGLASVAVLVSALQAPDTAQPASPADSDALALRAEGTLGYEASATLPGIILLESPGNGMAFNKSGWQVGGVNNNFAFNLGDASLRLQNGLFYSRTVNPQSAWNRRSSAFGFGNDTALAGGASGLTPLALLFTNKGPASNTDTNDQITLQRLDFTTGGLRFSGSYADVGKDFQGYNELVNNLKGSDPDGVKLLGLGMRRTSYDMQFSGVKGMNLASSLRAEDNSRAGHKEYGLSRTTQKQSLGFNFGSNKLEYTLNNLVESWDPGIAKKDGRSVETQALKFSGGLGAKSTFALGQTLTDTTTGANRLSQQTQSLAVNWNEWQSLKLNGSFNTGLTEQTGLHTNALNLGMTAQISPTMQFSGKMANNSSWTEGATTRAGSNLLDLKLTTKFAPNLTVSTRQISKSDSSQATVLTRDNTIDWAINPTWKMTSRFANTDSSTSGADIGVFEYGVFGKFGAKGTRQLRLMSRSEELVNGISQDRHELTYTQALGTAKTPANLLVKVGSYNLVNGANELGDALMTVQVTNYRPRKDTVINLGYFSGPILASKDLTYRSWGIKPVANANPLWTPLDLTEYREWGGEVTHQFSKSTRVMLKTLSMETDGFGNREVMEYGLEHRFGAASLQVGQRTTAQPDQTALRENWWRIALPGKKALPAWAVNSVRFILFTDSAKWGINQIPAWAAKPEAGLSLRGGRTMVGSKPVDDWSLHYAKMLDDKLLIQVRYEVCPRNTGNVNVVDFVSRGLLNLSYALNPKSQAFARFLSERRLDRDETQDTYSFGFLGQLNKNNRLQLQADLLGRQAGTTDQNGFSYAIEYDRLLNQDDSLVFKYRLRPSEFSTPTDHLQLEASFRRVF